MWHQIIPLGHVQENSARTALSLFSMIERRLELRFGKLGIADFFDLNNYGSDSNFQFMNWTVDNNGAYAVAATRAAIHSPPCSNITNDTFQYDLPKLLCLKLRTAFIWTPMFSCA